MKLNDEGKVEFSAGEAALGRRVRRGALILGGVVFAILAVGIGINTWVYWDIQHYSGHVVAAYPVLDATVQSATLAFADELPPNPTVEQICAATKLHGKVRAALGAINDFDTTCTNLGNEAAVFASPHTVTWGQIVDGNEWQTKHCPSCSAAAIKCVEFKEALSRHDTRADAMVLAQKIDDTCHPTPRILATAVVSK